jgi:hypothetical protein
MDARANTKWDQLIATLGKAAQLYVGSNDNGRAAAIFQLSAILKFFEADIQTKGLTTPLCVLLSALADLHKGGKPAKILEPQKLGHRQRDDIVLRTVKVVAAIIMDQLREHAKLSRSDAAKEVAKVFSEYGLRNFQGRAISATAITKWRDQAKEAKDPELAREFNRIRSIDTEVLGRDVPLERKRDFLIKRRLPLLLIQIGAQGEKAAKTRQRLISDIDRRIPKKPTS